MIVASSFFFFFFFCNKIIVCLLLLLFFCSLCHIIILLCVMRRVASCYTAGCRYPEYAYPRGRVWHLRKGVSIFTFKASTLGATIRLPSNSISAERNMGGTQTHTAPLVSIKGRTLPSPRILS